MRFDTLVRTYRDRWENKNQGIPLNPEYKRLREVLPSWDQAESLSLMGGSGVGKTKILFKIAILDSLTYMIKNPTKMKVRIILNSLEMTELEAYTLLVCYLFKKNLKIEISREYLLNKLQSETIDEELFQNLEKIRPSIEFFNTWVTIKDDIRTGEAWFNYCKKILDDAGTIDENGKYVKKNPNLHFILITDTLNALSVPKGSNKTEQMAKFSGEYMKQHLRNFYKATCIQVQQIEKQRQSSQYSQKGVRIEEKYLISATDGKDYKSSEDDNSLILGLFLPQKYRLEKWEGFDVSLFKDKLCFIYILKSNFTPTNIDEPIPFYIDHGTLSYQEIPDPKRHPILYQAFLKEKGLVSEGVQLSTAKLQFQQLFNKEENGTIEIE